MCSLGLSANQPAVLFFRTKSAPATSYQSAVLFSHNKSTLAISHSQANTVNISRKGFSAGLAQTALYCHTVLVTGQSFFRIRSFHELSVIRCSMSAQVSRTTYTTLTWVTNRF